MDHDNDNTALRFLSVCSGIEAASVAFKPLGWKAVAFSEIENFPSAVLAHHYPDVPNLGDMTKFKEWPDYAIELLCGGTPCQSFSQGGLRKGLDDPRGSLMLTYLAIARRYRPATLVWENVPGVLSSNGGRDFGTFLGGLAECGYGFAYRILDAQFFGSPQQRRRVVVVGCLGDPERARQILFEHEGAAWRASPKRTEIVSVCLTARGPGSLDDRETYVVDGHGVRHLTPLEHERIQGFPDEYTLVPYRGRMAADQPRSKALGNSWAVPKFAWLGRRIQALMPSVEVANDNHQSPTVTPNARSVSHA
ncbi:DNA (cytosine-5-)-methyltransferase [Ensifer sp. ENS04]|uniref:DNA cytosine methyltransferase n=1 Tax=Ensifer sp. ENS04 TaxID=2769281 RepID=UPI00177DDB40|nr:DNA (cytosine-5-)-methyltransferase [Ensifer sp. ENS04]MBD9542929.1 DNA (cytosine-5-)-methyltransferase [Ensifer sp. ENS04]